MGMVEAAARQKKPQNYVGSDVFLAREAVDIKYPIQNGIISDWVRFEVKLEIIDSTIQGIYGIALGSLFFPIGSEATRAPCIDHRTAI